MVDLHTHVMFGWDDGAENIETSLEMARMAAADGVRIMAATPHLRYADETVNPNTVRERVAQINAALQAEGIGLTVVTGTEIPASWDNLNPLKDGQMLTLGDSRTALIEMPFRQLPVRMDELIFQLRMAGITPLIAHPERCQPFLMERGLFERTVPEDVPVQITTGSLLGSFGETVHALAWRIVRQERPIVVASDAHGVDYRQPIMSEARAALAEAFGDDVAEMFCSANPAALLANKAPRIASLPHEPEPEHRSLASRLKRVFGRR